MPGPTVFERGDIVEIDLDPASGREQKGKRRVLVVSPKAFNRVAGVAWVMPISQGGNFGRDHGFAVALSSTGLDSQGVILWFQLGTKDLTARGARLIERAPKFIVSEALEHARVLLEEESK
jgi:mRNA interferase ChpB